MFAFGGAACVCRMVGQVAAGRRGEGNLHLFVRGLWVLLYLELFFEPGVWIPLFPVLFALLVM